MSEVANRKELPSGAAAVLQHPQGSPIYLVGVAHVSGQAAKDAENCTAAVQPAVVVLELDQDRFQRLMTNLEHGDSYGLQRAAKGTVFQPLKIIFGGHLVEYGLNVAYAICGALLGVPPGAEFFAAAKAAERVGAEVVLADRDAGTTLRRLSRAAVLSSQQPDQALPSMEDDVQRRRLEHPTQPSSTGQPLSGQSLGGPRIKPEQVIERMSDKWRGVLGQAGCQNPDAVLASFRRILATGTSQKQRIHPEDILTVRECGKKVVETYRQKAIKEGDSILDMMEAEALQSVGDTTGLVGVGAALQQVLVQERDLILARRLWETGDKAAGRPVVGIVGAGHVDGIMKHWDWAGTPQARQIVGELSTAPASPSTTGSMITVGIVGGAFAWLAVKRPKIAAWAFGITGAMTVPYVGAMAYALNNWTNLLRNVADAASRLPPPDWVQSEAADPWGEAPTDSLQ